LESHRPSCRLRKLQWVVTTLCVVLIAINVMDRVMIGIANTAIRHDFHLTATAMGGLISAWSLAYVLFQIPAGFLLDRLKPRWFIGFALFVWSLAQLAGGFASTAGQLWVSRAALGVGESPGYSGAARVISNWFNPTERGLPTAAYTGASMLVPAISPFILTALMLAVGWHVMFIALGAVGIVAALGWYLVYRDIDSTDLPPEDVSYVRGNDVTAGLPISFRSWLRLFRQRTMWGLIFGTFGMGYVFRMYYGWLPAYLEVHHHISIARTGLLAGLPWLGGVAGAFCSGYLSDATARQGYGQVGSRHGQMWSRKMPTVCGLFGMALFTALSAMAHSVAMALLCVFFVMFFGMVCTTGLWSLVTVVTPRNYIGSAASIPNFGSYLGALCAPVITGFLIDRTGSFTTALMSGAAIGAACACCYLFMVKNPILSADLEPGEAPVRAR
jgi:MFS family permease